MNLSEPLDGLTSRVGAAALRVLARAETAFSGRQVHALSRVGSVSSVQRELAALVAVGVVTAQPSPPSILYRVNREHVLWPAIESGLAARDRAFDSIRAFCEDDLPTELGVSVVVYGSVARRDSRTESDVDLFLVYPDGFDDDARAEFGYALADHVRRVTGNEAQVYSIERTEFARRRDDGDPLVANVLADGIALAGPPLESPTGSAA